MFLLFRCEVKESVSTTIELAGKKDISKKRKRSRSDPDRDLIIRDDIRERLLRQKEEVASGERGKPLEIVIDELGLSKETKQ